MAEPSPLPWTSGSVPSICRYQCRSLGWWLAKYMRPCAHFVIRGPTRRVVVIPSLVSFTHPMGKVPGGFQMATQRVSSVV